MRDHVGVGVLNYFVCFVLLCHLLFWPWLHPEQQLYSLSVPVTHSWLFLALCFLIFRLGKIQSNFETRSFISSTNLGIFIGDLVSSPTTTSDLLPHQFPGHRQVRLWKRLSYKIYFLKYICTKNGYSWSHLLSLLCSRSPIRHTIRTTNRRLSTTPIAWLRLDRGGVSSPSSFICLSTVLKFNPERRLQHIYLVFCALGIKVRLLKKKKKDSHQITHSVCVPHKQILAIVRLQHKLRDADTCWRVTVKPYCGWNRFVLRAATLWLRRHYHIHISSWWKNKNMLRCCDH